MDRDPRRRFNRERIERRAPLTREDNPRSPRGPRAPDHHPNIGGCGEPVEEEERLMCCRVR